MWLGNSHNHPVVRFLISGLLLAQTQHAFAITAFKPESNCTRSYVYRNRTFPVDSSRKIDGEGLRTVLRNKSESEKLLNDYQKNLKSSRIPAYAGTVGLIALIGGPIYASGLDNPIAKEDTRYIALATGATILLGTYFIGQFFIKRNEKTLENAVQTYNDAVPKQEQIQVGFTPISTGDGGEIKTIVPFQF